jgi:hypothetical protein
VRPLPIMCIIILHCIASTRCVASTRAGATRDPDYDVLPGARTQGFHMVRQRSRVHDASTGLVGVPNWGAIGGQHSVKHQVAASAQVAGRHTQQGPGSGQLDVHSARLGGKSGRKLDTEVHAWLHHSLQRIRAKASG